MNRYASPSYGGAGLFHWMMLEAKQIWQGALSTTAPILCCTILLFGVLNWEFSLFGYCCVTKYQWNKTDLKPRRSAQINRLFCTVKRFVMVFIRESRSCHATRGRWWNSLGKETTNFRSSFSMEMAESRPTLPVFQRLQYLIYIYTHGNFKFIQENWV